jgi:hypothetical protein
MKATKAQIDAAAAKFAALAAEARAKLAGTKPTMVQFQRTYAAAFAAEEVLRQLRGQR